MRFEVEDDCFDILGGSGQVRGLVVAACLVVKSCDDQVAIDKLPATCPILKQSLRLCQIDECFFNIVLPDEIFCSEIKLF